MHFVKFELKLLIHFSAYKNNSLRKIIFLVNLQNVRVLFLRQHHFENMRNDYDLIFNVM